MALGRLGILEAVGRADAPHRQLADAVNHDGLRMLGAIEDRGCDVDHVVELAASLALGLDVLGPVHDRAVARAAQCEATYFVHWYGVCIAWGRPTA